MSKKKSVKEEGDDLSSIDQEKAGADYFKDNPNCPVDAILVCEDGTVFYSTTVGKNAAENHGSPFIEVTKD